MDSCADRIFGLCLCLGYHHCLDEAIRIRLVTQLEIQWEIIKDMCALFNNALSHGLQRWRWMDSPIGPVLLRSHGAKATGIFLKDQRHYPPDAPGMDELEIDSDPSDVLQQLESELSEFLLGKRLKFQTAIDLNGTEFQRRVWQCLMLIPFGQTTTYGSIAAKVGKPHALRAAGAAIGRNPLSILIPCHRVIGKSGELTGYAGGIARKRWLLNLESGLSEPVTLHQQTLIL